jgi:hypothetical protein
MMTKFLFAFCLAFSFLLPIVSAKCRNHPPTKSELIELLGNPVSCNSDIKNTICFGKFGTPVYAEIDSTDSVKKIYMYGCDKGEGERVVNFILSKYKSGKLLKSTSKSEECDYDKILGGGGKRLTEDYECLTVTYGESNCPTNCRGYGMDITWK